MGEGSRHERAAITIVAYIIGFTTAYIAFGVTQLHPSVPNILPVKNSAAVVQATAQKSVKTTKTVNSAELTPAGLFAVVNGKERIVSATQASPANGTLPEGYNVSIEDYAMSPDGMYLYYCEVPSKKVNSCRPYVYSVADDTVYPLTQNGARVAFPTDTPKASWNTAGMLRAGGMVSLSADHPWQM